MGSLLGFITILTVWVLVVTLVPKAGPSSAVLFWAAAPTGYWGGGKGNGGKWAKLRVYCLTDRGSWFCSFPSNVSGLSLVVLLIFFFRKSFQENLWVYHFCWVMNFTQFNIVYTGWLILGLKSLIMKYTLQNLVFWERGWNIIRRVDWGPCMLFTIASLSTLVLY